jgi:predicted permease
MIIQHLLPVFALLALGMVLRKTGFTNDGFLKTSDRLIYFIFFPVLLFWKIGSADLHFTSDVIHFYLAAACAVLTVYLVSIMSIVLLRVPAFQAGTFSQACYRFNTYIGMAVILTTLGETGVAHFGILIGILIPMINVLAVSTLIWYTGSVAPLSRRLRTTARAIVTNPLIVGCAFGLLYARWLGSFPVFVENTLKLGAAVTLPLALLSIGGSLTARTLRQYLPLASLAGFYKLALLPAVGYGFMRLFQVSENFFMVGMLFFALPTSTAIYVLSSQLNSDTRYASAAIVLSTVLSFASLSAVLLWIGR